MNIERTYKWEGDRHNSITKYSNIFSTHYTCEIIFRNEQPLTRYPIQQVLENESGHFKDVRGEVRTTQDIYVNRNNLVISKNEEFVIGVIDDGSIVMYCNLKADKATNDPMYSVSVRGR